MGGCHTQQTPQNRYAACDYGTHLVKRKSQGIVPRGTQIPAAGRTYRNHPCRRHHSLHKSTQRHRKTFLSSRKSISTSTQLRVTVLKTGRFTNGTTPSPFSKDELSSILNHAKPAKWQVAMLPANIDVYEMSWDQLVEYFERLELSQSLETRERKNKCKHSPEHHNQCHEKKNKRKEKTCSMCKTKGHTKEECWWNPENSDNKLKKNKTKKFKKGYKKYSNEEIAAMIAQLPSFNKNKPQKRKNDLKEKENSDSDENSSLDEESGLLIRKLPEINVSSSSDDEDYSDSVQVEHCYVNERPRKRLKPTPQSTEIVGEIKNREGDVRPIRVLLDTGTSATIVLKRYVMQGSQRVSRNQKTKSSGPQWEVPL